MNYLTDNCSHDHLFEGDAHSSRFRILVQTVWIAKDTVTGKFKPHKLKGEEVAVVDQVGQPSGNC